MICIPARAHFVGSKVDKCRASLITICYTDGLAVAGNAPKIFARTSSKGLPYPAIFFCSMFALLAFMGINSGSGRVFQWFANMTSVAGYICTSFPFATRINNFLAS